MAIPALTFMPRQADGWQRVAMCRNTVELIAFGEDAIHIVNGKVVMRLHGPLRIDGDVPAPVTSGQIILQSEGAEVFFRDVEIRSIAAIPPEFAAK